MNAQKNTKQTQHNTTDAQQQTPCLLFKLPLTTMLQRYEHDSEHFTSGEKI